MGLEFCSFSSGSSGNSYLVKSDTSAILIDVGIAGKKIIEGLNVNGLGLEDLDGILITHEHLDHVKSIRMIGRKAINAEVYGTYSTLEEIGENKLPKDRWSPLPDFEEFPVGDIAVKPFALSHDAVDPVGYTLRHGDRQVTIITDTGIVTDEMFNEMVNANLLVIEANHEVNILRMGSYPFALQQRILSDYGHLSNEACGDALCKMMEKRKDIPKVFLAHLSGENNTPSQAYLTIRNSLFEKDYYVDRHLELSVLSRHEVSPIYKV